MARILKNEEVKNFQSTKELKNFVAQQEAAEKWVEIPTNGVKFIPLEDNPICIPAEREKMGFGKDVSDDIIAEEMAGTKTAIDLRGTDIKGVYPVSPTGYRGIFQRAGAECSALTSLKETSVRNEIAPKVRADILGTLSKLAKGNSKLLIADEEVLADLSSDYVNIPISGIINKIEGELCKSYELVDFSSAAICHESTTATWTITDSELEKKIQSAFDKCGIKVDDTFIPSLTMMTSQVGLSGVNLYPMYSSPDKRLVLGTPVKMEHVGDASLDKFAENIKTALGGFDEFAEHIQTLSKVLIKNPEDCLINIGRKLGFTEKAIMDVAAEMGNEFPVKCDGCQIYTSLFDILDGYKVGLQPAMLSSIKEMQICENIARICFGKEGPGRFDYPAKKDSNNN